MHHPSYKSIKAAYSFYNVPSEEVDLKELMQDALIVAKVVRSINNKNNNKKILKSFQRDYKQKHL